jgi:hypothetical protein
MKRALITIATVGILASTAWVVAANAQADINRNVYPGNTSERYGARAPAYATPRPEDMPVEPTVALLVRPMLLVRTMALRLRSMPVVRPSPLALVGRPMLLLLDHMPQTLPSRMNGTPVPAQ